MLRNKLNKNVARITWPLPQSSPQFDIHSQLTDFLVEEFASFKVPPWDLLHALRKRRFGSD